MRKLIYRSSIILILISIIGSFTPYYYYFYLGSGIGFALLFFVWLIYFLTNKNIIAYIRIALYLVAIYLLIGIVFGLAIGCFPESYFLENSISKNSIGFINGLILSFSNLTTLSVTDYSPQNQFLKIIFLFESVISFFLLSIGIGLMVNESTKKFNA